MWHSQEVYPVLVNGTQWTSHRAVLHQATMHALDATLTPDVPVHALEENKVYKFVLSSVNQGIVRVRLPFPLEITSEMKQDNLNLGEKEPHDTFIKSMQRDWMLTRHGLLVGVDAPVALGFISSSPPGEGSSYFLHASDVGTPFNEVELAVLTGPNRIVLRWSHQGANYASQHQASTKNSVLPSRYRSFQVNNDGSVNLHIDLLAFHAQKDGATVRERNEHVTSLAKKPRNSVELHHTQVQEQQQKQLGEGSADSIESFAAAPMSESKSFVTKEDRRRLRRLLPDVGGRRDTHGEATIDDGDGQDPLSIRHMAVIRAVERATAERRGEMQDRAASTAAAAARHWQKHVETSMFGSHYAYRAVPVPTSRRLPYQGRVMLPLMFAVLRLPSVLPAFFESRHSRYETFAGMARENVGMPPARIAPTARSRSGLDSSLPSLGISPPASPSRARAPSTTSALPPTYNTRGGMLLRDASAFEVPCHIAMPAHRSSSARALQNMASIVAARSAGILAPMPYHNTKMMTSSGEARQARSLVPRAKGSGLRLVPPTAVLLDKTTAGLPTSSFTFDSCHSSLLTAAHHRLASSDMAHPAFIPLSGPSQVSNSSGGSDACSDCEGQPSTAILASFSLCLVGVIIATISDAKSSPPS